MERSVSTDCGRYDRVVYGRLEIATSRTRMPSQFSVTVAGDCHCKTSVGERHLSIVQTLDERLQLVWVNRLVQWW